MFIFLSSSESFFSSGYVEPETRKASVHCTFYKTGENSVPLAVSGHHFLPKTILRDILSPVPCPLWRTMFLLVLLFSLMDKNKYT